MIHSLLLTFALGNPYTVVEPNPFTVAAVAKPAAKPLTATEIHRRAVETGGFLVWFDNDPLERFSDYDWPGRMGTTVVTISGPYHGGRHITYATLQSPTREQIEAALATARETWEAERTVTTRAPNGHTHTCPRCATTWDHKSNNSHNCPECGTEQFVQDARPRPVTVKVKVKPQADPFVQPAAETAQQELPVGGVEALDELNELRKKRGLKPYIRDNGLTLAAARAAKARADRLLFGHLDNDFVCLPSGTRADAAGCAAYANTGWLSCCMWESATYAGAAYVVGKDGKRYMHLFIRN